MPAAPAPLTAARGQTLLVVAAVAFSTSGFFARTLALDPWAVVLWRNLFGAIVLAAILAARRAVPRGGAVRLGSREGAVVLLNAAGTLCFLLAFAHTSVANIAVIYAAAPMLAAALAWAALGERMDRRTMVASGVALAGVALTVGGSIGGGTLLGDGLALAMTLALSVVAVLARGSRLPPLVTAMASALMAALAALPLGTMMGARFAIGGTDALWLAGFGIATMAVALPCYLRGASAVPAGRTMLISALEMPLSPLWVWLAFAERPGAAALAGGLVVLLAIVWDLRRPGGAV